MRVYPFSRQISMPACDDPMRKPPTAKLGAHRQPLNLREIREIANAQRGGGLMPDIAEQMRSREIVAVELLAIGAPLLPDEYRAANSHHPHEVLQRAGNGDGNLILAVVTHVSVVAGQLARQDGRSAKDVKVGNKMTRCNHSGAGIPSLPTRNDPRAWPPGSKYRHRDTAACSPFAGPGSWPRREVPGRTCTKRRLPAGFSFCVASSDGSGSMVLKVPAISCASPALFSMRKAMKPSARRFLELNRSRRAMAQNVSGL